MSQQLSNLFLVSLAFSMFGVDILLGLTQIKHVLMYEHVKAIIIKHMTIDLAAENGGV